MGRSGTVVRSKIWTQSDALKEMGRKEKSDAEIVGGVEVKAMGEELGEAKNLIVGNKPVGRNL